MDFTFLVRRFWYAVWFIVLPAGLASLSALLLDRLGYFDGPWHVLLAFAVFAIVTYGIRDRLPWWAATEGAASNRRIVKEAKHLAKETRRMLRRHGHKLEDETREQIAELRNRLVSALQDRAPDQIVRAFRKLDVQVDRHLAFARKSTLREYTESIGVAVLIALLLRAFVVEAFKIPSGSMIPTLQVGDHIFVNKFVYGLRMPFTYRFIHQRGAPRRGDVVVFVYPHDERKDFIKRIVGLEGDVLELRDGVLHVNGRRIERCPVREVEYREINEITGAVERHEGQLFIETMAQGGGDEVQYHVVYNRQGAGEGEDWGPERVPPGQVYVMGDNRDNSHDSRRWGGVPLENIKGRAWVIWWSNGVGSGVRLRFDSIMREAPRMTSEDRAALSRCSPPSTAPAE